MVVEESATYTVTLKRPVFRGSRKLLPRDRHRLRGFVLQEIIDREGEDVVDHASVIDVAPMQVGDGGG